MNSATVPRQVALFPLPDHVLLPGLPTPYRVFEPRYVQLIEDLMKLDENERWIGIPRLSSGWQRDYEGSPDFHTTATIARVEVIERNPEGHYDIVVIGLHRARLSETDSKKLYRLAEVELRPDHVSDSELEEISATYTTVLQLIASLQRFLGDAAQVVGEALADTSDISTTVFGLASIFIQEPDQRQKLLETESLAQRLDILADALAMILATANLVEDQRDTTNTLPS